ncbi:hypothetical protein [Vibrio phage BONAISHI]|nr:hypothetical protein [Vibrio phage BONAISHI]
MVTVDSLSDAKFLDPFTADLILVKNDNKYYRIRPIIDATKASIPMNFGGYVLEETAEPADALSVFKPIYVSYDEQTKRYRQLRGTIFFSDDRDVALIKDIDDVDIDHSPEVASANLNMNLLLSNTRYVFKSVPMTNLLNGPSIDANSGMILVETTKYEVASSAYFEVIQDVYLADPDDNEDFADHYRRVLHVRESDSVITAQTGWFKFDISVQSWYFYDHACYHEYVTSTTTDIDSGATDIVSQTGVKKGWYIVIAEANARLHRDETRNYGIASLFINEAEYVMPGTTRTHRGWETAVGNAGSSFHDYKGNRLIKTIFVPSDDATVTLRHNSPGGRRYNGGESVRPKLLLFPLPYPKENYHE